MDPGSRISGSGIQILDPAFQLAGRGPVESFLVDLRIHPRTGTDCCAYSSLLLLLWGAVARPVRNTFVFFVFRIPYRDIIDYTVFLFLKKKKMFKKQKYTYSGPVLDQKSILNGILLKYTNNTTS